MDLKHLSDNTLLANIKNHVQQEREILPKILHHLKEIDRRRLFCVLKYKSLFEYCEKELGYPGDQAYRRIAAMKLLKELPEIEARITSGTLSLSNLGMARTLFKKKSYSRTQKLELLATLENKSARDAAKVIAEISPETLCYDKIRPVTSNQIELRFIAPQELQVKLENLKGQLAHSHPNISLGELIDKLANIALEKFATSRKTGARLTPTQKIIFARDQGKCSNCDSIYALEVDHIMPQAVGGKTDRRNLRLLCRKCNQRAAIENFGPEKMEKYLRSPRMKYSA